jgi:hypothetical protein
MIGACENCGNHYERAFTININNEEHIFDCFECAINKMAPRCHHCRTPIIGHGIESEEHFFCCNHCSKLASTEASLRFVTETEKRVL